MCVSDQSIEEYLQGHFGAISIEVESIKGIQFSIKMDAAHYLKIDMVHTRLLHFRNMSLSSHVTFYTCNQILYAEIKIKASCSRIDEGKLIRTPKILLLCSQKTLQGATSNSIRKIWLICFIYMSNHRILNCSIKKDCGICIVNSNHTD